MANPHDYTVGWICATFIERVAARAFLDEIHEGPEYVAQNDNNNYTIGRIGKHNVVIAAPPDGECGLSSAATVGRDMLHSFQNVRIGLMVGVAGGAPSPEHDIRLGDVVVSSSGKGKGGVFQYDHGVTIQGQKFQHIGVLNQPPQILRSAVSGLRAQYESDGHRIQQAITEVFTAKPRLQTTYKRPDATTDRLFKPEVIHPVNGTLECAISCAVDPSTLVERPDRTEDEDDPFIHYGLIASANQLMKDAIARDALAAEKDVLCFEMEAAGLMNHFPCLVIRGICGYSDSHNTDAWQRYAAMTATAYAKDLLLRIPTSRITAERRIEEVISTMSQGIDSLIRKYDDQEHESFLKWLTTVDYTPRQAELLSLRQPGTGQWLLDAEQFQAWVRARGQTLFCPGIPGAGKTFIASKIIDYLQFLFMDDQDVVIAYIYCNFQQKEEQKARNMLLSLLRQVAAHPAHFSDSVRSLYDTYKNKRIAPSMEDISRALLSISRTYSRVFFIVDALDECHETDGNRRQFLSEIFNLQKKAALNLLMTSRSIPDIEKWFEGCPAIHISACHEDLWKYLDTRMSEFESVGKNLELQQYIKSKIEVAASGMFLLAMLYIDSLVEAEKRSGAAFKKAVEDLQKKPKALYGKYGKLYEAYNKAMERIQCQLGDLPQIAQLILSWIVYARRPITVPELQHALAVEFGTIEINTDNILTVEYMIKASAPLVKVDTQSNIVHLFHYTAQEYFERFGNDWLHNAQSHITRICVTYLLFEAFEGVPTPTGESFQERRLAHPLYDYSARHWGDHARESSTTCDEVMDFLLSEKSMESSTQALFMGFREKMTSMHLVAYFGIAHISQNLILQGSYDSEDGGSRTPLSYSAERGHKAVVQLLLNTGKVNVNTIDRCRQTPLFWAAGNGHKSVVRMLLEKGKAEADLGDLIDRTPLSIAAENGHRGVVKMLLDTGRVDINLADHNGQTALFKASRGDHVDVVKTLLDTGKADANTRDKFGRTPLSKAAMNGHRDAIKILLDIEKLDVNAKDQGGQTALSLAAQGGYEDVVQLLLNAPKIDVNARDQDGRTPLSLAAWAGYKDTVQLLLSKDNIDVDARDLGGQTPLSLATDAGVRHIEVSLDVAYLGADTINYYDYPRAPSCFAWNRTDIVKLLLDTGNADADAKDQAGQTPLSRSARNGYRDSAKLLLDTGRVDINNRDKKKRTPLYWAARNGHTGIVELLLDIAGVDVDAKDQKGQTPLSWSARNGHSGIVKLLLDTGKVNAHNRDEKGRRPRLWALVNGHLDILELLCKAGDLK
ncbi:nucleoside phosphorylase domain-containing [Trichoderma arundinaceum]|uniref:Nucleoside phosphorylase domain-containing n=1 Tax=Trichoderma arundinaceum TaxID=490622 RepID=A0A395NU04_TRIAR|nr:nucleoside phosphorylase domain-containing [Trichoderma arundinaceum]